MKRAQRGFTLIELLVVIAIIVTLMAIVLPAVQRVRQAAAMMRCGSNLKQIAIAVHNYEVHLGVYPPSMLIERGTVFSTNNGSWSVHGRILPFVERGNEYARINLEVAWDAQGNTGVPRTRIPVYICPSEANDRVRLDAQGLPYVYPQNYGFNFGTWSVYDPRTGQGGDGMFYPNARLRAEDVKDGHSNTLMAAEVKAFTPYVRNTADPGATPPADPSAVAALAAGGQLKLGPGENDNTGHTEWPDGRVHHSGFTTTFSPNTVVPYVHQGVAYDIDYNSRQEGNSATIPTRAAITARSYHPGGINVVMMDGAVRQARPGINLDVWRALGTRKGKELIGDW